MSMAASVPVSVPPQPYTVDIGSGLLSEVGERLLALTAARRVALVTDENVAKLYAEVVESALSNAGFTVHDVVVVPGEGSKCWETAGHLLGALASAGLDRTDLVIALGGGVIGDLAGFAAATYLRGVDLVQLPTTLLSQVDSSVGGKTGVDLEEGKNLAGAFKQPLVVLADTDTLASLPESEWRSGLAEVGKAAILDGEDFLSWLEASTAPILEREPETILDAVRLSVEFKARVVSEDEREAGPRECLNYGHTFGHALEKALGYGVMPHGVAVAEGIRFAARLAVEAVDASPAFAERQGRLLDSLGIPRVEAKLDAVALRGAMSVDKKARAGTPRFVLLDAPGSWHVMPVSETVLDRHIEQFVGHLEQADSKKEEML